LSHGNRTAHSPAADRRVRLLKAKLSLIESDLFHEWSATAAAVAAATAAAAAAAAAAAEVAATEAEHAKRNEATEVAAIAALHAELAQERATATDLALRAREQPSAAAAAVAAAAAAASADIRWAATREFPCATLQATSRPAHSPIAATAAESPPPMSSAGAVSDPVDPRLPGVGGPGRAAGPLRDIAAGAIQSAAPPVG
jgi:hypothetical protein